MFLHTVYQGLSHQCKDIPSELGPLLANSDVTDDTILRHVMKITSDEKERLWRLGPPTRVKQSMASSAQVSGETDRDVKATKGLAAQKGQDDPIKHLTARIDALTSMVDAIQYSMEHELTGAANALPANHPFAGWAICDAANDVQTKGDRTVHTASSVERMVTGQWGAYNDLSSRETGAGRCKEVTSDHTANAPARHYSPGAGQV